MNLKGVFPASLLKGWPAPSLAQCTVNGRLVCLQDNLAQEVLYVNKKLMTQFGYTGPDDVAAVGGARREGRQGASRLHHREHGRLVRRLALPVARPLPDLAGRRAEDRSHQLGERSLHPHGEPARSADQERAWSRPRASSRRTSPRSTAATTTRSCSCPGPTWYAKDIFGGTLKVPAGEITAAMPLRWNSEPPTTGQVGGGPWVVSKHTKNVAAAIDFVKFVATTSHAVKAKPGPLAPGYPSYGPAATVWLKNLNKDPYFAAPPGAAMKAAAALVWKGWSMVTYQDQPVWSTTVVTQLVAGQVAERPAAGVRRGPLEQREGGRVQGREQVAT